MISMIQTPEIFKKESDWDINFSLLQKHMEEHGESAFDKESPNSWMVTVDPKLNQWLVYTKIELKKARRQEDPQWQERKQKLQQLGIQF